MRIAGRSERKRLAELEKEARDVQEKTFREHEVLHACKLRSRRRKAIRECAEVDDGLSDFGREVQEAKAQDHDWVKSMDRYVAEFGAEYPDIHEDIFALEVSDKKVQAAWKRKLAADAEWEKVRDGIR